MLSVPVMARALLLVALPLGAARTADVPVQPTGKGVIRGIIRTDGEATLEGAQLRLLFGSVPVGRTESDETGAYMFTKLAAGPALIEARRIGYKPESLSVVVKESEPLLLNIHLTRAATELSAVRVMGRREIVGPMAGFYKRQQTGGGGRYFNYAEIVRRNPISMSDLMRNVPGVRIQSRGQQSFVRIRGSMCAPLVVLDGQALMAGEVDLDAWDPKSFEGVEVYSGPAAVPVEFQRNQRVSSSCGTIVLWSRQPEPREPRRKKGDLSPSARIAAMLEEGKTFLPAEVDRTASLDSLNMVKPFYPDSLFDASVGGRVIAEVVISTNGEPIMETFSAVTTTHRSFVEPVRRALKDQRFSPAVRRGSVVQQVLQLPFEFVPDSTARRRRS